MKALKYGLIMSCLLAAFLDSGALTNYVVPPGTPGVTPTTNYVTWDTAATNIIDAIDVAIAGNVVMVTNGMYHLTNVIQVTKGITMRSWHDGEVDFTNTIIVGSGATNCFYLNHASAVINGFTISNGNLGANANGGGVYIHNAGGIVRNCVVADNIAKSGGGIYINNNGRVEQSIIRDNQSIGAEGGGGVYFLSAGVIDGCLIQSNSTTHGGGGIYMNASGTVYNSTIVDNIAASGGGGIQMLSSGILRSNIFARNITTNGYAGSIYIYYGGKVPGAALVENCVIVSNILIAKSYIGGGGIGARDGASNYVIRCCLIAENSAPRKGGGIAMTGPISGMVENCTIVRNQATNDTGYGGGISLENGGVLTNCIIYYNTANTLSNCYIRTGQPGTGRVDYSCSFPAGDLIMGGNNITNEPLFVATNAGNYRLTSTSPCINRGINQPWMATGVDLDGKRRIDNFGRIVDMGAYEHMPSGTMFRAY